MLAMLSVRMLGRQCRRRFSLSTRDDLKVSITGACGAVGRPLALLLKQSDLVRVLAVHDKAGCGAMAGDLAQMDTRAEVLGYDGAAGLPEAIGDADLVVIATEVHRRKGMTRAELFQYNAPAVRDVALCVAEHAPDALVAVLSQPLNSLLPLVCEALGQAGNFNPARVFGVTTLDCVRAATLAARAKGLEGGEVSVPVVGGCSGPTAVPVFSQTRPPVPISQEEAETLTGRLQNNCSEEAAGAGAEANAASAAAYAGARFCEALMRAMRGERDVVECALVRSDVTRLKYLATPVLLGRGGMRKNFGLGSLNAYEQSLLKGAMVQLQQEIAKGEEFMRETDASLEELS